MSDTDDFLDGILEGMAPVASDLTGEDAGKLLAKASEAVGAALARAVFKKMGGHSEIHLGELELAALLAFAHLQGVETVLKAVAGPKVPPTRGS